MHGLNLVALARPYFGLIVLATVFLTLVGICLLLDVPSPLVPRSTHHLFPAICFVHYPAIAAIVRDECAKRGVPYASYATLPQILARFVAFMRDTGAAEQRPMATRFDLSAVDTGVRGRFTPMPGQQGCPMRLLM